MQTNSTTSVAGPQPLVSCLCVTRNKPALLRRAIECFDAQNYTNRELVVIYEDDDVPTAQALDEAAAANRSIRVVEVPCAPRLTLGQLRNLSVDAARGEFFCQWDDDDWYHAERISRQVDAAISNGQDACLLTNWIMFDEISRQAYFSHFRLWEGSLLCRKKVWADGLVYPSLSRNEDNVFVDQLMWRGCAYPLVMAGLYIYTTHHNNTWPRKHFEEVFARSQKLSPDATHLVEGILGGGMSHTEASAALRQEWFLRGLNYFATPAARALSTPGSAASAGPGTI